MQRCRKISGKVVKNEAAAYRYGVYGIALRSEIPLPLPEASYSPLTEIECRTASASWFNELLRGAEARRADSSWYCYAELSDQVSYARWEGVGEFVVSADGKVIVCRQFDGTASESFGVYLLGQALSFALVKQGLEPLHGTSVVVEGEAVVFLGDSGFGKSSLAACFLAAGRRILTDDLLILRNTPAGILAYPGPPRLKVSPRVARMFLRQAARGANMNPFTRKMVLPLSPENVCGAPVPLRAMYAIAAPGEVLRRQAIRIDPLSAREGFVQLLKNTFNQRIVDADRLRRQFSQIGRLVDATLVKRLSYPRALDRLPAVCEAILCDLEDFAIGGPEIGLSTPPTA